MFKNKYQPNFRNNKFSSDKGRSNFRVRGPIKSFRDLEVYTKTTALSADIFSLQCSQISGLEEELGLLKNLSKHVPKMIAESYGNRFDSIKLAEKKLEKTAELITAVISKVDFILSVVRKKQELTASQPSPEKEKEKTAPVADQGLEDFKKKIESLLKEYSTVRTKVLNLKKAWVRINETFKKN